LHFHAIDRDGTKLANQHCDGMLVFIVDRDCVSVLAGALEAYAPIPLKIFYSLEETTGADLSTKFNGKFISRDSAVDLDKIIPQAF
jgi:hypothetical protein